MIQNETSVLPELLEHLEPDKKIKEHLRYEFTDPEQLELSKQLSDQLTKKRREEANKKMANSQFKKTLDEIESEIELLSSFISSGFEVREVDCVVFFNRPADGRKTVYRKDTGELVNVYLMTQDDLQMALEFKEQKEKDDAAAFNEEESELEKARQETEDAASVDKSETLEEFQDRVEREADEAKE